MEIVNNLQDSISSELNQNDELQKKLLMILLSSRRLLSDHADIIEESLDDCIKKSSKKKDKLTALTTTSVVATSYAAFAYFQNSFRYAVPCITSVIPLMYIRKQMNVRQRKISENILKVLIKSLDEFESGVKKTLSFLNDALVMDSYARILQRYDRKNQIPFHLVDTIKRVIRAIYCFTKYMEYYYKLDSKWKYLYQEIDDVDNCELMRQHKEEWDVKSIKEFFSLFAYVQSYALHRLGLIIASSIDDGKYLLKMKVSDMTKKIKLQIARIPTFLEISQNAQRFQSDIQEEMKAQMENTISKELRMISTDAIGMSVHALSYSLLALELQYFIGDFIKNQKNAGKKSIDEFLNRLESIGNQLSVCNDEQTRIVIAVKKYLKKESEGEKIPDEMLIDATTTAKSPIKTIKEDDKVPQKDDFFYADPTAVNEDAKVELEENEEDPDEEEIHKQLTKKCFKPVLLQLKEKIVPIGVDMKEREKKVLKEKGIEITDDSFGKEVRIKDCSDSGSDDERERKLARTRSKFDESRELLMSKKPFNVFGNQTSMPIPIKKGGFGFKEQILE